MSLDARDALLSCLAGVDWPFEPLLAMLDLTPGADVLDIGAGDGRLLARLREQGHQGKCVGLDPQPGQSILAGQAEALPFPEASFDAALLVRVLAHLADPAAALAEARRVLRPRGRLIVAAHGPDHLRATWRALGQAEPTATPAANARHLHLPVTVTAEAARALAASYGLSGQASGFPVEDTLHLTVEDETAGGRKR